MPTVPCRRWSKPWCTVSKPSYLIWLPHSSFPAPLLITPVPSVTHLCPAPPPSPLPLVYTLHPGQLLKPKTPALLKLLSRDWDDQTTLTFSWWVILGFVAMAWISFSFSSLFTCCRNGSNWEIENVRTLGGNDSTWGRELVFLCEWQAVLYDVNASCLPSTFPILNPSPEVEYFWTF